MAIRTNQFCLVDAFAEDLGEPPCSQQCRRQWCWTATIQTVRSIEAEEPRRQCAIVTKAFPNLADDCCNDTYDDCDSACPVELVPRAFANNGVTAKEKKKGTLTLKWIREVVMGGGQVAVGWKGPTSNHMVLVVKASLTKDLLGICDPDRFGCGLMTLNQLKKPEGRWKDWEAEWVWKISGGAADGSDRR